jgi:hypothetical protein
MLALNCSGVVFRPWKIWTVTISVQLSTVSFAGTHSAICMLPLVVWKSVRYPNGGWTSKFSFTSCAAAE